MAEDALDAVVGLEKPLAECYRVAPFVAGTQQEGDQLGAGECPRSETREPFGGLFVTAGDERCDDVQGGRGRALAVAGVRGNVPAG